MKLMTIHKTLFHLENEFYCYVHSLQMLAYSVPSSHDLSCQRVKMTLYCKCIYPLQNLSSGIRGYRQRRRTRRTHYNALANLDKNKHVQHSHDGTSNDTQIFFPSVDSHFYVDSVKSRWKLVTGYQNFVKDVDILTLKQI